MATDLAERPLELEPVVWQHRIPRELPVDAEVTLLSNDNFFDPDQPLPKEISMVWGGYGEKQGTLERALPYYAALGERAIGVNLNVDDVPASQQGVLTYILTSGPEVVRQAQERGLIGPNVRVFAHSMSGGIIAIALQNPDHGIGDIGFLEPAAHSTAELRKKYPNDIARELILLGRLGKVLTYPFYEASMPEKMLAAKEIGGQILHDTVTMPPGQILWNKFHPAATVDPIPNVQEHALGGNKVIYVMGSNDPIVVPGEVIGSHHAHAQKYSNEERLRLGNQIQFIITNNRHLHMIYPAGREHFRLALSALRGEEVAEPASNNERTQPRPLAVVRAALATARQKLVGLDEYYDSLGQ